MDVLDEQPVTKDITGCEEVEFNGAATENVTFSYGEETIISDVSIPVLKGSIIGISGRSGSGKSTIAKLDATDEEILDRIQQGIQNLKAQTEDLIIVTNEIFSDGCRYDAETVRYIRLLGNLNIRMAEEADAVTEVVYGIPICRKGEDANEQQ